MSHTPYRKIVAGLLQRLCFLRDEIELTGEPASAVRVAPGKPAMGLIRMHDPVYLYHLFQFVVFLSDCSKVQSITFPFPLGFPGKESFASISETPRSRNHLACLPWP